MAFQLDQEQQVAEEAGVAEVVALQEPDVVDRLPGEVMELDTALVLGEDEGRLAVAAAVSAFEVVVGEVDTTVQQKSRQQEA